MITDRAYSTTNPEVVTAYRTGIDNERTTAERIIADAVALGAGDHLRMTIAGFSGSRNTLTHLPVREDGFIPDGWRVTGGRLKPRRGKAGAAAVQWLKDHQPADVRADLEQLGLPRSCWIPTGGCNYNISSPIIFEHDGTVWASYAVEPGRSGSGFDDKLCTWTPRKLSEFHAAAEQFEATSALVPAAGA